MTPDRVAFLGTAQGSTAAGQGILVQLMCWPIVATAWSTLSEAWQQVREGRSEPVGYVGPKPGEPTWVGICAPQLGGPFRDTTAQESSVASFIVRTPMRVAIAIQEVRDPDGPAGIAAHAKGLSDCLTIYHRFATLQGRRACAVLVSGRQDAETEQRYQDAFDRCRTQMPEATWLRDMRLQLWKDKTEPLPLELAHIAAESVVRHHVHKEEVNPILDALLTKSADNPFASSRFASRKRR